ncbi:MAG: radical SAM protein, partial [Aquificaceae bacterium]
DSEEELRDIARFIKSLSKDTPWHISRFFPAYRMINLPPTPTEKLRRAYQIGKEEGLEYIYVGNYPASDLKSTYCPSCSYKVIERGGYLGERIKNHLLKDRCPKCKTKIAGVFV